VIRVRTTAAVVLTSAAMIVGLMSERGGAHPTGSITWSSVSRVLEQRCLSCHGPQGSAQPRLDSYDNARLVAEAMKSAVLERRMPPSYAVEGFGEFANDPALTPIEVAWIADWVDAGTTPDLPGAETADPPPADSPGRALLDPATHDAEGDTVHSHVHHSREEDLVLQPARYQIDRPSHTFELPTGLTRERWVRGWEVRPGNAALVLSATISIAGGTTIGTWMAGDGLTTLPEDVGARLPQDSTILLTVKYRRATRQTPDETSVRLLLADAPRRELRTMSVPCGTSRIPRDVEALAVRASSDMAGESLTVEARRPDRSIEPIAWFRNFPRAHDRTYRFRRSIALPEGTAMTVAATDAPCGVDLEYVTP
jgi:hypothetical protein